ncbi:MAG: endonuclease III [Bacteroidales bacterium]
MLSTEERFHLLIDYFSENQPIAETELHYESPYQLLVAVILSAQCTDKRVNIITPPFYKKFPDATSLSLASQEEIYELIKSCSYPNNKAKNLLGMAKALLELFNGNMPDDVDELQKLPGVGRKTANVIASVVFNKPAMAVDTHVFRVSERIGLTTHSKNPLETEKQLVKHIPPEKIPIAHHWLILHGRYVCMARKPNCLECKLKTFCRYYEKKEKSII